MLCYGPVAWWEKIVVQLIVLGAMFFYLDLIEKALNLLLEYLSRKFEHRSSKIAGNLTLRVRPAKSRSHAAKSRSDKVVVIDEQARPLP
ncbi:unnamed protein product [Cylicocyclus nassatus]|uniref:Uncharacterized protein n=1 Tax=Cylicocyclus nassatus TaxID=53992 RepID=A0AA36H7T0_CYLNA|nr:unnamed protein product [Cylicocyclus nassatus]